jgi:hypothetical protein
MGEQTRLFLLAVFLGFSGGLLYGVIRLARHFIYHSFAMIQAEDFIFWLVFTAVFFFVYYAVNFAYVREFNFFGVFLGILFSFYTIDKINSLLKSK